MFSSRLPRSLAENRISQALAAARRPLFDLTESNPTAVGLALDDRGVLEALADPRSLTYTPTPHGLREARVAVAAWYARHGATVDADRIFLTASTSEAYALLFKLLCDPGDRVLAPRPSYPLFDHLAALESIALAHYPLRYHSGWFVDAEEVARALDERTRALLIVNPNNPTGSYLTRSEHAALDALAAERSLATISDEVFADYPLRSEPERVVTLAAGPRSLTFCLGGLSKLAGLPQLKLGWIAVCGPDELVSTACERLEMIADTYLSVGAPVQHAAARLLEIGERRRAQIAARTQRNYHKLVEVVRGSALQVLESGGGWSAIVRVPALRSDEDWVLLLLESGVVVHPGFFFDLSGGAFLVVSLLPDEATFDEAMSRLIYTARPGPPTTEGQE
jgi:alanine-synthesizing transaminase